MPTFLGLGCNICGAFGTRVLETRKQRFVAMTLMAIVVPCAAQIAMLVALFFGMDIVIGEYQFLAGELEGMGHYFWLVLVILILGFVPKLYDFSPLTY